MKKSSLFLSILLLAVYWRWFLPGPRVANDLHLVFFNEIGNYFFPPYTWGSGNATGLGEYAVFVLWGWPLSFINGLLGYMGFSHASLVKSIGFLPTFVFGLWGIKNLTKYFKLSEWGFVVASFLYLVNSYILLLIDGGQLNLAVAYSLLPLTFFFYREAIDKAKFRYKLKFAIFVLALSVFDIRIVYFLALLVLVDFVFEFFIGKESALLKVKKYFLTGLVTFVVLFGFHAYWVLPAVFAKAPSLPLTYGRADQVEFLSFATLGHSLYLLQPHWHENVFGWVTHLRWEFIFIPILVFLAPILKPRSRWVGYWLVVTLGSTFLVKGSLEPLARVYPWLFENVPGFSLFRDPTKFFFLTALSYSMLLGVTVSEVLKRFNWRMVIGGWRVKLFPVILIFYLLLLAWPVYTGQMTGTFGTPVYQEEYFALAERLHDDKEFGRIFWISTKPPLGYFSHTHPSLEAARLIQERPFAVGTVGTYEVFNFLREASFMGEIFNVAGIEYLVYPFLDARRAELKQDNIDYYNTFLSQLSNLSWIEPLATDSSVPLLKTKKHQDRFFIPQNTIFVVGSDDIYNQVENFEENAMIFIEEQPGLLGEVGRFPQAKILLNNRDKIDMIAGLLDKDRFVSPAQRLGFDLDETGWWKRESADFIEWRAFLQNKYGIDNLDFDYGGGWAVAEKGSNDLVVPLISGEEGDLLLARVMESSRSGLLKFSQKGQLVGRVSSRNNDLGETKIKLTGGEQQPDQIFLYDKAEFHWHKVGELRNDKDLAIEGVDGDINVVNMLAVVSREEWESLQHEASELLKERSVGLDNLPEKKGKVEVSYETISPTHYKVRVSGLSGPSTLAFSENYDSLWQVSDGSGMPLYSLINGFPIPGDGEYEVKFVAQQYVKPGLVISGATLLLAILGLLLL